MKKFKWFGDVREIDPSKKNEIIITGLDGIIENICKIHTFQSIFENLEYSEYFPTTLENSYDFAYGNFKDFLEKQFIYVGKRNKWSMMPPLYYWVMDFGEINIKLNKEQMQDLLLKNYNFYKGRITNTYDDNFELKTPLYYDLGENKFTASV